MSQRFQSAIHATLITAALGMVSAMPATAQQRQSGSPAVISAQGVGPIRFGMTVKEASAAAKQPFWVERVEDGGGCKLAGMKAYPDLEFTVDPKGRIQGVCTSERRYAASDGARVGEAGQKLQPLIQGGYKGDSTYRRDWGGGNVTSYDVYQGRIARICAGKSSVMVDMTGC